MRVCSCSILQHRRQLMRIGGYGSGFGGYGDGGQERGQLFRKRHRVGDRLRGVMLRWEAEGLAWVNVEGQELLAEIATRPEPGQYLYFLVRSLVPEIVLQEILPASVGAQAAFPDLARTFWSARTRFESSLRNRELRWPGKNAAERKTAFFSLLAQDTHLALEFAALLGPLSWLNLGLKARGAGRIYYLPWLLHEPLACELLATGRQLASGSVTELALGFDHLDMGHCELQVLLQGKRAGVRLLAEHPDKCLAKIPDTPGLQWHGVSSLPHGHTNVLSALLKEDNGRPSGGFTARV